MKCTKCYKEVPDESVFCQWCGYKLKRDKKKTRTGNGTGHVFKRGDTWTARVTVGWKTDESGKKIQQFKTKGGFSSKKEALKYIDVLKGDKSINPKVTFTDVYNQWHKSHQDRIVESTMTCYECAFKHFDRLKDSKITSITANDLQRCIDECPSGKRTKQIMKVVANLIMKYAMDERYISVNPAANLYTGKDPVKKRDPITEKELEIIQNAFSTEPYAKYVYAMTYLGFRPGEFFSLKKSDLHVEDDAMYVIGGSKTDAGRDRAVTISPKIAEIIAEQCKTEGDWLFPRFDEKTGKASAMTTVYFRNSIFKPMMKRLGIEGKVPYCARHSFADRLKNVEGADADKAALTGHSRYSTTQRLYQSSNISDKSKITDQL